MPLLTRDKINCKFPKSPSIKMHFHLGSQNGQRCWVKRHPKVNFPIREVCPWLITFVPDRWSWFIKSCLPPTEKPLQLFYLCLADGGGRLQQGIRAKWKSEIYETADQHIEALACFHNQLFPAFSPAPPFKSFESGAFLHRRDQRSFGYINLPANLSHSAVMIRFWIKSLRVHIR